MPGPAGIDLTWLTKFVRDQLQQSLLAPADKQAVGTITIKSGIHIEGDDIQLSPAALAQLKTLLGL